MLASIAWLGGLTVFSLFLIPLSERQPNSQEIEKLLGSFENRMSSIGWFSILVLLVSGMLQMSSNPNYLGLLNLSGRWAYAILIKHIFFFVMVAINAWLTWGVNPAIRRARLQAELGREGSSLERLQVRHHRLVQVNLVFAALVLVFTAIARISI